jgi:hypothetical protein
MQESMLLTLTEVKNIDTRSVMVRGRGRTLHNDTEEIMEEFACEAQTGKFFSHRFFCCRLAFKFCRVLRM